MEYDVRRSGENAGPRVHDRLLVLGDDDAPDRDRGHRHLPVARDRDRHLRHLPGVVCGVRATQHQLAIFSGLPAEVEGKRRLIDELFLD